jgi:hypothetical protein
METLKREKKRMNLKEEIIWCMRIQIIPATYTVLESQTNFTSIFVFGRSQFPPT